MAVSRKKVNIKNDSTFDLEAAQVLESEKTLDKNLLLDGTKEITSSTKNHITMFSECINNELVEDYQKYLKGKLSSRRFFKLYNHFLSLRACEEIIKGGTTPLAVGVIYGIIYNSVMLHRANYYSVIKKIVATATEEDKGTKDYRLHKDKLAFFEESAKNHNNMLNLVPPTEVPVSLIQELTGLSRSTIYRALNFLKELEYINAVKIQNKGNNVAYVIQRDLEMFQPEEILGIIDYMLEHDILQEYPLLNFLGECTIRKNFTLKKLFKASEVIRNNNGIIPDGLMEKLGLGEEIKGLTIKSKIKSLIDEGYIPNPNEEDYVSKTIKEHIVFNDELEDEEDIEFIINEEGEKITSSAIREEIKKEDSTFDFNLKDAKTEEELKSEFLEQGFEW